MKFGCGICKGTLINAETKIYTKYIIHISTGLQQNQTKTVWHCCIVRHSCVTIMCKYWPRWLWMPTSSTSIFIILSSVSAISRLPTALSAEAWTSVPIWFPLTLWPWQRYCTSFSTPDIFQTVVYCNGTHGILPVHICQARRYFCFNSPRYYWVKERYNPHSLFVRGWRISA